MSKVQNQPKKIVVFGSCSIDYVTYSPRIPVKGETLKGSSFAINFGGKGANQCIAAAKLGGDTAFIAKLGDDDLSNKYIHELKSHKIDVSGVEQVRNTRSGIAQIMVSETSGENVIVIVPGTNDLFTESDVQTYKETINHAKVLVMQCEIPLDVCLSVLRVYDGISILNAAPGYGDLHEDFFKLATIFCLNETEASIILDMAVDSLEQAKVAVDKLVQKGCRNVVLTLGDNGALLHSDGTPGSSHVSCEKVKAVDTTGAGDSFVGSLAYLLSEYGLVPHEKMLELVQLSCALATYSVQRSGTSQSFPDATVLKDLQK